MSIDRFPNNPVRTATPAREAWAVIPGDAELPVIPCKLFIGVGGDVTLRAVDSQADVTYKNVGSGVYLHVRAMFVRASTTATNILAEL